MATHQSSSASPRRLVRYNSRGGQAVTATTAAPATATGTDQLTQSNTAQWPLLQAAAVPSHLDGHSLLLCLAALLSAGVLIRTLHPRFRHRLAKNNQSSTNVSVSKTGAKGKQQRDHLIKKIIQQQQEQATLQQQQTGRDGQRRNLVNPSNRSDPATSNSLSTRKLITITSNTIVCGLQRISAAATAAIASTSAVKLDDDESNRPGPGSCTSTSKLNSSGDGSSSSTSLSKTSVTSAQHRSAPGTSRRSMKTRKGKAPAAVVSSGYSSANADTPEVSPTKRTHSASTMDAAVQTSFPEPRQTERSRRRQRSRSSGPTRREHGGYEEDKEQEDESGLQQSGERDLPRFSDRSGPPSDALDPSKSPETAPRSMRVPSLSKPFDLHASFQSTPPMPSSSTLDRPLLASPPGSPSPSWRTQEESNNSKRDASPTLLPQLPLKESLRAQNSSEALRASVDSPGSQASSKSRKQTRKASAAAALSSSAEKVVVGLPRPDRLKATPDDGESAVMANGTPSTKGKGKEDGWPISSHLLAEERKPRSPRLSIDTSKAMSSEPTRSLYVNADLSSSSQGGSSSNGSSPYLSHQALMSMTPLNGLGVRRSSATSAVSSHDSWSSERHDPSRVGPGHDEGRHAFWRLTDDPTIGTPIEMGTHRSRDQHQQHRSSSRRSADGVDVAPSWSSTGGSSSPTVPPSVSDGYFPPHFPLTAFTTPDTSPHPSSRLLPFTSMSSSGPSQHQHAQQKYWTPQVIAQNGLGVGPGPFHHPGPGAQHHGQSRPASRQSSLSVPNASHQPQLSPSSTQQQHLQQQQAYAFYAHAQAQYQHVLALQLQAQQHHQRQQAAVAARQRHEVESSHNGGQHHQQPNVHGRHPSSSRPPLTPTGLVYPISSSASMSAAQNPPPASRSQSWTYSMSPTVPSGGKPFSNNLQSPSPTSSTFAAAPSSQYSQAQMHAQAQAAAAAQISAMYFSSPTTPQYPSAYGMTSPMLASFVHQQQQQQQQQHQQQQHTRSATGPDAVKRHSSAALGGGVGLGVSTQNHGDGKKQRPSHNERSRTDSSTTTLMTMAAAAGSGSLSSPSTPSILQDSTGWKIKVRTAEMEADRSSKELEIARWRLVVLEEEQRQIEIENQEALKALAMRAMRAEARIKLLDDSKDSNKDSSSNGSGSPATRAAAELGPSPSGKLHPLSWLDLDSVSFSVRPPSNAARIPFPSSSSRRRAGRNSGNGEQPGMNGNGSRRRSGNRRRSSHGPALSLNSPQPMEEEDEEEILILLDSPIRPQMRASSATSRRSSLLGDDFGGMDSHDSATGGISGSTAYVDDDELSAFDMDEAYETRSHRGTSETEYIGSLPTFLTPGPGSHRSRSPSLAATHSPLLAPVGVAKDDGAFKLHERSASDRYSDDAIDPDTSLPSFILDRATPNDSVEFEQHVHDGSPLTSSTVAEAEEGEEPLSSPTDVDTPKVPPPISPPSTTTKSDQVDAQDASKDTLSESG